jgi:hypothetical protein
MWQTVQICLVWKEWKGVSENTFFPNVFSAFLHWYCC